MLEGRFGLFFVNRHTMLAHYHIPILPNPLMPTRQVFFARSGMMEERGLDVVNCC